MLKLFDANELIDKVKTENMMLLDKIKNLELENKLIGLLVQKSPLDKTGLGFADSISMSETHSTNFVSSSKPPKSEIVKLEIGRAHV